MALAAAVFCILPDDGRADDARLGRDYATVGRIVVRVVEGRTVIVVPVAGRLQPTLSEPFRVGNHWRVYLTIQDARLSVGGRPRRAAGVLSLDAEEIDGDVRIAIDVDELGEYGARRSEEGILLWIDAERRPVIAAAPVVTGSEAESVPPAAGPAAAQTAPAGGSGRAGLIVLAALAAAAGGVVRYVRRNGIPDGVRDVASGILPAIRERLSGGRTAEAAPVPAPGVSDERVPFQNASVDPRGRSAEIGDAFRLEPERPASGIAALAATIHDNDV